MTFLLLCILLIVGAADAFFSAAVIYHLRTYTLPAWTLPKVVIPAYLTASIIIYLLAVYALIRIVMA